MIEYSPEIQAAYGLKKAKQPEADMAKSSGGPFIGKRGGKWADPQHKIPWNEKKHAGKPAPTEKPHDEHGARELELHIDNTEHLTNETKRSAYGEHQTQRGSIHQNLARKIAAGKYDHAQASKLFQYHVDEASKHYSKEYGAPAGGGHHFDAATRRHVAREMANQFHDEVIDGEHDHHVATGVHAKRAKAGGGLSAMAQKHVKKSLDEDVDLIKSVDARTAVERAMDLVKAETQPADRQIGSVTYKSSAYVEPPVTIHKPGLSPQRKHAIVAVGAEDDTQTAQRVGGQLIDPASGLLKG